MAGNFLKHLHTGRVSRQALRPTTTFGLGVACLTCLGILIATGLTLFLHYVPDQAKAYERILHITTTLRFGKFVRNLHYLAANALLVFSVLHLARVALTAGYKHRRLNWCYGLILLLLILFANFTGYLLPWDQISYWAVKVGASLAEYVPLAGAALKSFLLGGDDVGHETLLRSFAFHAGSLPLAMLAVLALHLWRIRKDGGLAASEAAGDDKLAAAPWLYRAEGGVAFSVLAALTLLALLIDAPISERADPSHPPNPAKAPWYFVGIQELISHSALIGGIIVPIVIALFLLLLPLLDRSTSPGGRWLAGDRWIWSLMFLLLLAGQIICIIIGQWLRGPNWQLVFPF
ncbi:MAG TPA: cytochrome b N-terminal domain-containing protein [Geopsychrobacteraceae bacterium]|jgi:quinol-cytochrome oxidoreductase complex cytochrome b subunit